MCWWRQALWRLFVKLVNLLLLVLILSPGVLRASAFDTFGLGSRSRAMGNTGVAISTDISAIYYNPANLSFVDNCLSIEISRSLAELEILLGDRPAGYDPLNYESLQSGRGANTQLPSHFALAVGYVHNFGLPWLKLGALVYLPYSGIGNQSTSYPDQREQYFSNSIHFELLGSRLETQLIHLGFGVVAADWLRLGAGVSIMPQSLSRAQVYTKNPVNPTEVDMNLDVRQSANIAANLGATLSPWKFLTVGLSWRQGQHYGLETENEIQIKGMETSSEIPYVQEINTVSNHSPSEFLAGVKFGKGMAKVTVEGSYRRWKDYLNSHGDIAGFGDTLEVATGFELAGSGKALRLGARWVPSPVEEQTGRTNYVDNDRAVLSVGGGYPVSFLGSRFDLSAFVQLHIMLARENTKTAGTYAGCTEADNGLVCDENLELPGLQTGNPGFPWFSSGGWIVNAGGTATWKF